MEHFSTSLVSFIWPAFFTFLYFCYVIKKLRVLACLLMISNFKARASKIKAIHPDRRLTVRHLRQILMKETRNRWHTPMMTSYPIWKLDLQNWIRLQINVTSLSYKLKECVAFVKCCIWRDTTFRNIITINNSS